MNQKTEEEKKDKKNPAGLLLVIPFNSTSDLLIMSLEEYEKFKRRGEITRKNRQKKGKDDL